MLSFHITHTCGAARRGVLETAHGRVETPAFMAVGTQGAVKALMHRDLALVPYAIALGRAALHTVRVNVALALALKALVIVAAGLGLASLWLAVLADVGASLLVVGLSLRLLSFEVATDVIA